MEKLRKKSEIYFDRFVHINSIRLAVDEMGVEESGIYQMGVDEMGSR